jgi:parallel beta-helix repeat protein
MENLTIEAFDPYHCVEVHYTHAAFRIADCSLVQHGIYGDSVFLSSVETGSIINNTCGRIRVESSNAITVANNSCSEGILLRYASFCNITGNTATLRILFSEDNHLAGNDVQGGSQGIDVISSDRNSILGNRINGSSVGIEVSGEGWYPSGVYYPPSHSNTLTYNIMTNCHDGIVLYSGASDTLVQWNLFAGNVFNAEDRGQNNAFDYNYWSDYTGIDLNFDGIGDSPYLIRGSARSADPHPLMAAPGYPAPHPLQRIAEYLRPLTALIVVGIIILTCCLSYLLYMRRYRH